MGYIWLNLKFTLKYTIVGGEGGGGIRIFLRVQTYSFGHSRAHAKFQNRSFTLSRLNWVRVVLLLVLVVVVVVVTS